jgi:hypothetical protein
MFLAVTRGHAVLVVIDGGRALVLDNEHQHVYSLRSAFTSEIVFAVNEDDWWIATWRSKPAATRTIPTRGFTPPPSTNRR